MTRDTDQSSLQATVMVITDDHTAGDNLTRFLVRQGLTVVRADTGAECCDLVRMHPVDVVLLDVMMPGMDGLAVCAQLRQLSPAPPIFLVTAKDDMTTRAAGIKLGISEFVVKPVNHADLLARIQASFSIRRREQEADRGSAATEPPTPPTRTDRAAAAIELTNASPTVLIVDDNKDNVDIHAHRLKRGGLGVHVLRAYNGRECLEILRTHTVDLLILDDNMPQKNGFDVLAVLQHTAAPPIMFLTGHPANREAALRLGARGGRLPNSEQCGLHRPSSATDCTRERPYGYGQVPGRPWGECQCERSLSRYSLTRRCRLRSHSGS